MSGLPSDDLQRPLPVESYIDTPKLVFALLYLALVVGGLLGALLL